MLRSIYTAKLNCINDFADKLIVATEKYQINDLKEECEDALVNNISIDNCLDCLKLSQLLNAEELECKAYKFINLFFNNLKQKIIDMKFFDLMYKIYKYK